MSTFTPKTPDEVAEVVRWAASEEQALELVGRGTKRGLGRPVQAAHTLDLSGLSGVVDYEPAELVLTARPGTPMAELEGLLAAEGQHFAFEPADLGPLLGGEAGQGTLGGALGCNLAGPRRIQAGAARDHFLGFSAVSGRGEAFKAGARVVKNVTGYDLMKLVAGSYGTLAALTEVSVKVLPAPATVRTLLVHGLDDATAIRTMAAALKSPHEVSSAAHIPAAVAHAFPGLPGPATAIRIEGVEASVGPRATQLADLLMGFGEISSLDTDASKVFWRAVRDVQPFVADRTRVVWRVSVPPAAGASVAAQVARDVDAQAFHDWGGGLIWIGVAPSGPEDGGAAVIRAAVAAVGGHATLMRAPEPVRAVVDVFHPQPPALAALAARVKAGFDPGRILNPGRMAAGV
ncbi:MAG TPA: glycolate oxidase subunit GlcE [Azospirillaceae bacterium]|nr:glycolate oxidase subunit GlcE [Azospirillaceae bacterium]